MAFITMTAGETCAILKKHQVRMDDYTSQRNGIWHDDFLRCPSIFSCFANIVVVENRDDVYFPTTVRLKFYQIYKENKFSNIEP